MELSEVVDLVGPELARAMEAKGFTALTPVQSAILDPELAGRDLRVSSQTGSGKTIAIGLAVRELVRAECAPARGKDARPRVLVVVPTRELAKQVEEELSWLYKGLGLKVASVTGGGGGGGYRDELRAFRAGPAVVVGTPGRLLDHLERGALDASNLGAVVLDEADRMLDMGFREDIEKIFERAPAERSTHLVSATFPREVARLADRVQSEPARVEGTPLGAANVDIEHVVHLVREDQRLEAIVNLILSSPGSQNLVFARTRADVSDIARALQDTGFVVGMLSGEMEQPERLRALAAFKAGRLDALIATDVAARGIDVQDIARVVHAQPPSDPDAYTHRSGRTGRAGKKGTSSLLVTPHELVKTSRLLSRAAVRYKLEPIPSASSIRAARDQRMFEELTADGDEAVAPPDARALELAERLAHSSDVARVIARLVARSRGRQIEPREVTAIEPPASRRPPGNLPLPTRAKGERSAEGPRGGGAGWVPFRVSWGQVHGADARRLVAMLCRRGGIEGGQIGAIRVGRTSSVVEVAAVVAESFERAASAPDPRDKKVVIRRWREQASGDGEGATHAPPRREGGHAPPKRGKPPGRPRSR
jgi:ATP-dependent RNA helicase DeaD